MFSFYINLKKILKLHSSSFSLKVNFYFDIVLYVVLHKVMTS